MDKILSFLLGCLCGFVGMSMLLAIIRNFKGGDKNE